MGARPRLPRTTAPRLLWWASLLLLGLNDHLLKGLGTLPTWLTGKLSDFAGLVVAPVLLVVLTRARTQRAQLGCLSATATVFAALQLSPELAAALESVAPIRIWPDPTDLVALLVLPLSYWVVRHLPTDGFPLGRAALHRTGVVVASLTCLATSFAEEDIGRAPFVENRSHLPIEISHRRYLGAVDCAGPELVATTVTSEDFAPIRVVNVEPTETRGLNDETTFQACGAFWIEAKSLPAQILVWNVLADDIAEANTFVIEGPALELRAFPGPGLAVSSVPAPGAEP